MTSSMDGRISAREFHETSGVEDWRVIGEGVCACFRTGSLADGVRLAAAISAVADGLRADLDLRPDGVTVRIDVTPDPGVAVGEVEFARRISAAARELGLAADPSAVQTVQVSVDALDRPAVAAFWRAVLGWVERDGPEDIADPQGRGPAMFFQRLEAPRPQRNRIHVDVYVPHDRAEARVAAALAAGGRLVTDQYAPDWWVLADAEGNEACVATFGWAGPPPAKQG